MTKRNLKGLGRPAPQTSFLFKVLALLTHCQLRYLTRNFKNVKAVIIAFVVVEGIVAIGTIAAVARLTNFPLLFPPLGPSAFILFFTPMAARASPRNCVLAHTSGVIAGLLSLQLSLFLFSQTGLVSGSGSNWAQILAICLAMGLICGFMIGFNCSHPPAAATALMGAMGYFNSVPHVIGILSAVLFLVIEAFVFNRILGGLPYPFWASDDKILNKYGALAGLPSSDSRSSIWSEFADKVFERRIS